MIEIEKMFVNNSTPTIQEEVLTLRIENAKLKAKLKNIDHYLAHDIPHELMNEATKKIWKML